MSLGCCGARLWFRLLYRAVYSCAFLDGTDAAAKGTGFLWVTTIPLNLLMRREKGKGENEDG